MAARYIETPRTDAGNATFMTNGHPNHRLSTMSIEQSFHSPTKGNNDDLLKPRKGLSLRTPRSRVPFGDRRNLPTLPPKSEFTPLMKSVTKQNFMRGVPETPAFLKDGYRSNGATPGLPRLESSAVMDGEHTGSDVDATPVPNIETSSAQDTPLAVLPRRDGGGVVLGNGEDGQGMTLREQEKIIDQVEKENWGFKLKIHFLEEALRKAGPHFNEIALKENTELKVSKVTMQKELHRYRKSLNKAEQDLEQYRIYLAEMQEKARRKYMDEGIKEEMEKLKKEAEAKDSQIKDLRSNLDEAEKFKEDELAKLKDEVGDLEAELREKERFLDDRDDEIETLKANSGKESRAADELEEELEAAKRQIEELQNELERAKVTAQEATEERDEAQDDKKHAEEDLNELRDEMANKSFHTKGLSRQLEEKAHKQEDELNSLRREHNDLKEKFEEKAREGLRLEERIQELGQDVNADKARYQDDLELARHERDAAKRSSDQLSSRLQQASTNANDISEQKDLLQTRHDALTNESRSLQKDLARAEATIGELERAVADERKHALINDRALRAHNVDEIQSLTEQIDELNRQLEDMEGEFAVDRDHWESERRNLESEKQKVEEKATGLGRTVSKLQESEGTLSGREMKLQEAMESETLRHQQEEEVLNRQVKELNEDVAARRETNEELRSESMRMREQLRTQKRHETSLEEKIQALEDEIEVLQSSLDEEADRAHERLAKGRNDIDRQLEKVLSEKQTLRDQVAGLNIELANLQAESAQDSAEKDELNAQVHELQRQVDDIFRQGQEKSELRLTRIRLGSDIDKLNEDKLSLTRANKALQKDLEAEIQRSATEEARLSFEIENMEAKLAQLAEGRDKDLSLSKTMSKRLESRVQELEGRLLEQSKQSHATEGRDRELSSARNKAQRLEQRMQELEARLLEQHTVGDTSAFEISTLHEDLAQSRRKEVKATQRHTKLQQTVSALKSNVSALEHQVQDLHTVKTSRDSAVRHVELESLREQLDQAQQAVKQLRAKNRDLERDAVTEEERKDLHSLLKSSKLETESLSLRLSDREAKVDTLRAQLKRVRGERGQQTRKAEVAATELDTLHSELEGLYTRYESCLADMAGLQSEWDGERKALLRAAMSDADRKKHEKEMTGLAKEMQWMRVRLEREKGFRQSLAWSKGFLGEEIRVRRACNEANLHLIAKMGVHAPRILQAHEPSRFKAVALAVRATIRLQRLSRAWREVKQVGEGLQVASKSIKGPASAQKERRQRTPFREVERKREGRRREV